jgi:phosphatidylinositol glycan class N
LVVIFLTFSPVFIILSLSYEGLFYFAFCLTLLSWVRLEHHIYTFEKFNAAPSTQTPQPKATHTAVSDRAKQLTSADRGDLEHPYRALELSDARIALFFFFLLQSAFFSTGNIGSISSFSLESVFRLIPVFDPFSQGALLMLKLMIPFAVISANLGILNRRLGMAPSALFMLVMAFSDVMTLNFFFLVKDEGSWLDIGTTISNFSIASVLSVFVALLELASEIFVSGVEVEDSPEVDTTGASLRNASRKQTNGKMPRSENARTANGGATFSSAASTQNGHA